MAAGSFAAGFVADSARPVCAPIDPRLRGALGTLRTLCASVGFVQLMLIPFGEKRHC